MLPGQRLVCVSGSLMLNLPQMPRDVAARLRLLGRALAWIIAIVRITAQEVVEGPGQNSPCLVSDIIFQYFVKRICR